MQRPKLSVVIPCYNEEACLEMLHARVSDAARWAVGDDPRTAGGGAREKLGVTGVFRGGVRSGS